MRYLPVFAMLLSVAALVGCAPCGDGECEKKLVQAEQQVADLQEKLRKSVESAAKAEAEDGSGSEQLKQCLSRLEKCEKDPFTGGKYLTGNTAQEK